MTRINYYNKTKSQQYFAHNVLHKQVLPGTVNCVPPTPHAGCCHLSNCNYLPILKLSWQLLWLFPCNVADVQTYLLTLQQTCKCRQWKINISPAAAVQCNIQFTWCTSRVHTQLQEWNSITFPGLHLKIPSDHLRGNNCGFR